MAFEPVAQVACRSLDDKRPSFLPGGSQQPRERKTLTMSNYFGIGVDAAVALDFHQMRERRPEWFWSQLVNKLWYFRSLDPCRRLAYRMI